RSRKIKVQTKTAKREMSPRLQATSSTPPLAPKVPAGTRAEAAEPKLTPKAIRALEFAVRSMERKDWSLNRRRLVAFHHLQSDRTLTNLNPDDLITEDLYD